MGGAFVHAPVRRARRRHPRWHSPDAPVHPVRRSRAESSEERRMTVDIGVPAEPDPGGGPDLVQLLTPEGQRREHPDYPLDITAEEIRGLYRDLVLVRRIDVEATALQRQGELGHLGQPARARRRPGRVRPGDARGDYAFPAYREHGVACAAASTRSTCWPVPRGEPRRLGPEREELPPLHRSSSAPRRCTRPATPWACRRTARERGHRLLRRRRDSQGDVNERSSTPASSTHRSCSSARTTSGPSPSRSRSRAGSRSTSGRSASASPGSGSTATTCWPCWP
jgi:hypothetical protein